MWSAEHDGPGAMLTSVQPAADINDVAIYPGSGLIFAALETEKLGAYFIPALGPAPRWCHFIDGLTEEMEQAAVVDGGGGGGSDGGGGAPAGRARS